MGQSCGIGCCLTRAAQFAHFEINEPSFAEFCPLVQRYGELVRGLEARKAQKQDDHWSCRRWDQDGTARIQDRPRAVHGWLSEDSVLWHGSSVRKK